jgi:hypothetical protein
MTVPQMERRDAKGAEPAEKILFKKLSSLCGLCYLGVSAFHLGHA